MRRLPWLLAGVVTTTAHADDIVFVALSGPLSPMVGQNATFSMTLRNDGPATANSVLVPIRSSLDDRYFFADDPLICEETVLGGFGSGQTRTLTAVCAWPAGLAFPYVVARAIVQPTATLDPNVLNNDAFYGPISVGPSGGVDLRATSTTLPASALPGDTITVGYRLRNDGTVGATASTTEARLSANSTWDAGDPLLCSESVGSVAAGANLSRTLTGCRIPSGTAAGPWRVLVRADAGATVSETDESNNTDDAGLQVTAPAGLPDLVLAALSGPATARAGDAIDLTWTARNDGGTAAGAVVLSFRLGASATYNPLGPLLCQVTLPALAAGATTTTTTTCTLPTSTPSGAGWVTARVDDNEVVAEDDETNNTRATALTATAGPSTEDLPDLAVRSVGSLPSVTPRARFSVGAIYANDGTSVARPSRVVAWLSADDIVDAADPILCEGRSDTLDPGASETITLATCAVPRRTEPGTWTVIVQLDADEGLREADESNNLGLASLTVDVDDVDLPGDTGEPEDSDVVVDSDNPSDDDPTKPLPYTGFGCACSDGPTRPGGRAALLLLLGALSRRRRFWARVPSS